MVLGPVDNSGSVDKLREPDAIYGTVDP